MCAACPKPEECTKTAFKGADCWSYESEDKVRNYVRRHLEVSAKHYASPEDAVYWASMADIREEFETYEERVQYGRALAAANAAKTRTLVPKTAGARPCRPMSPDQPPPRGRSRSPPPRGHLSMEIRELTKSVHDVVKMQIQLAKTAIPNPPASSSGPSAPELALRPAEPMVQVPASSLRLLASSLNQIRECVERLTVLTPVIVNAQAAMEQLASGR